MPIASGKLREKITIRRRTVTQLPDGSGSVTWSDLLTTYADVRMKQASLDVVAAQDNLSQVFVVTIRYRPDVAINIDDRLSWRGRDFKIHSIAFNITRSTITLTVRAENESSSDGQI